uniref:USP domain-containing protein n=1 Tax=Octopus bimaculoides TaxID=37653 RepID=A0A0L8HWH8_OCTBM|eukprot:XP_014768842.1 PREDICTED: ubiquitin carboxyl-terminal hydrolase 4-like [Octopus bimaculoides]
MSTYLYQLVADFIVFKLIDSFAKSAIHDATNDSEKRRIWFYESGFLAAVSFPIYLLDHTPYLLWLLTVCTFLFTQLIGQLHLLYWWNLLKTRWDEHLQHQESLQRLQNNSTISVPSMPASPSPAVTNRGVSGISQPYSGHQMVPQQPSVSNYDHLLPNTSAVISQYGHKSMNLSSQQAAYLGPHYSDNHFLPQQKHLFLHSNQSCGSPSVYFPENITVCSNTITQNTVGTLWPHNMRRRPLRPSVLRSASPFPLVSTSQHDTKTVREISFKDKLLSSFGFTPKSPPGLENDGQNLCFMNCILQCLARSPHLVSQLLMVNIETIPNVNKEEKQFLSEFIKILNKCSAESQTRMSVLDTEPLKLASQMMKCSLLNEHTQQDAAEFLMWLLTTTHNILNKIHLNKGEEMFLANF